VCGFEQTAADDPAKISENPMDGCNPFASQECMTFMKVIMNNIRQPADPKPEVVECAIVELLEIAQRQGITPADFI
jgi:hypothetical protein